MTIELRCSALPRIEKCPASAYITGEVAGGEDAALGTLAHDAIERLLNGQPSVLEPSHPAMKLAWTAKRFVEEHGLTDLVTERELRGSLGMGVRLAGHPDLVGFDPNRKATIIDWKSGSRDRDYSAQLKGYALLSTGNRSPEATAADLVTVWLRTREADVLPVTVGELRAWGKALAKRIRDAGPDGERIPGEHCEYCPARDTCPKRMEHMGSALALLRGPEGTYALDRDNLAYVYPLLSQFEAVIDRVRQLARESVAANGPIPLPDGRELRLEETRTRDIDVPAAWRFDGMPDIMDLLDGGTVSISVPKLMQVVADAAPKGSKGEVLEAFEKKLIEGGVLRVETKTKLAIRKREVHDADVL